MSEKRRLGRSDLQVTAVGLGCMGSSHAYGAPTEKPEAVRMIRSAVDGSLRRLGVDCMLCKKPYIIPIPGSRKEERLWENLRAKDVRLSENEIAEIDALLDRMEMPVYGQHPKKG